MIANDPVKFEATGHADGIDNGECFGGKCFFSPKGGVNFIDIWVLN